ncbi:MAG: hypothetical protein LUD18_04905 [Lachnospiraceae bacterium]|nr:hypothetical protein [Lachnospiraceae bacterium]
MKRCIVCGNIGNDDSVVCNVCGNPFIDMEIEAEDEEDVLESDERIEEQLKDVLTKVQDDEPAAQPDTTENPVSAPEAFQADEPSVTVLPEADFDASVPQGEDAAESFGYATQELVSEADDRYKTYVKQAETHAEQAEASAKQAEEYAGHAEIYAKYAEICASNAEMSAKRAAEEPIQNAAKAFAKSVAETPAKEETATPVEMAAEAFARRETEAPIKAVKEKEPETMAAAEAAQQEPEKSSGAVKAKEPAAAEVLARQLAEAQAETTSEEPAKTAAAAMTRKTKDKSVQGEARAAAKDEKNTQRPVRPRRTKSGPQIYGQESAAGFDGAQGVIRKDVHGGHAGENLVYGDDIQNAPVQPRRRSETARRKNTTMAAGERPERPAQRLADGRTVAGGGTAGRANGSNAAGAPAQQPKPPVQPYAPQAPRENRGNSQQPHHHSGKSSGKARKVMEASKDALTSPLLLFVALLQTVFLAGSVAAVFMRELSYGQLGKLLNLLDLPSQLSGYVSMFQSAMTQLDNGALAINLAIRVPDLLLCLGFWMIWILAHRSKKKMSGFGFGLVQFVTIIEMIAACAVLLVVLILSVTLVIAAWSGGTQSLIVIAAATLVGAIIVTMAIVMYFFCYLSTIRIIKTNARTGELCGKVSVYVAVIHMILALIGIINILSGIVNMEMTSIAAGIGQLGWMLLFGVWILKYRSTLSAYNG